MADKENSNIRNSIVVPLRMWLGASPTAKKGDTYTAEEASKPENVPAENQSLTLTYKKIGESYTFGGGNDILMAPAGEKFEIQKNKVFMGAGSDMAQLEEGRQLKIEQQDGRDFIAAGTEKDKLKAERQPLQLHDSTIKQGKDDDDLKINNEYVKNNSFDGGVGTDYINISGKKDEFAISFKGNDMVLTHKATGNQNTFKNYEKLKFLSDEDKGLPHDIQKLKEEFKKGGVSLSENGKATPDALALSPAQLEFKTGQRGLLA